ncbi:hypothetical protein ACFZCV_33285 [Streptomyces sp. NPDC007920]|uniref:hypothetical protein n=1 Tax=unclassified Streptomyces TaxID=2593676 RepID=UPI0036EF2CA2
MTGPQGTTSTAVCPTGEAIGGGYQAAGGSAASQSAPVFTGSGPATGWQATSSDGTVLTAYAICTAAP